MSKILIYQFWDVLHFFSLVILAFPVLGHAPFYFFRATRDEKKTQRDTQRDGRVMSHKRTIDHQLNLATDAANCQKKKGRRN